MSIGVDLTNNAKAFLETATDIIGILEKNTTSFYRIKNKIKFENELSHVRKLITLFNELMFFNGVFIIGFSDKYIMSIDAVDKFSAKRDEPIVFEFEKTLQSFSERFDTHAQKVHGLGSEMIILFKEAISLRRSLIVEYHSSNRKKIDDIELQELRDSLSKVWPLEERLNAIKENLILSNKNEK